MRSTRSESGQTLVLVALSMTVLMGFVAFAANMGVMFQAQRNLQIAADAAASAGALSYNLTGTATSAQTAAQTAADNNGVTGTLITSGACSGTGTLICVYTPPVDGPNRGTTGYVEVMVRQAATAGLIGMFTGSKTMNVGARAVAAAPPGKGCVYAVDTSGTDLTFTESGNMTFPNCNIYSDSTAANSLSDSASGNITANLVQLAGSYSGSVSNIYNSNNVATAPTTNSSSVPGDPLASKITPPPAADWPSCAANTNVSSAGTIQPGCYDGLNINAGSGTVTLASGLYIINGTFNISAGGNTTVTGTGVTFYFPSTGDSAQLTGAAKVNLTAPTTAVTADGATIPPGVLFYQNKNDTSLMNISASGSSNLTGIIYIPGAELELSGSATSTIDSTLVVGSLDFTGSMNFENYDTGPNPLTPPVLVE
jgi:Flp pilus assembly protein TadG/predicted secreted protein